MSNIKFISVSEALSAIIRTVKPGPVVEEKIQDAAGYVLAQAVKSPYHSPPFDNSAMDGYAFRFEDHKKGKPILVVGEVAAGKNFQGNLKTGEAVRIFTGAEVPSGADTVVMQERIFLKEKRLLIRDDKLVKGSNIRLAGSQVKKGAMAAVKGIYLSPGAVGFIASLGIEKVKVFSLPKVAIIVTGNELIQPGKKLLPGKIYESNSVVLNSQLITDGIKNINVFRASDTLESTRKAFIKALSGHDFVLFTGGISVGEYDFVEKVLDSEKVKTVFYKIKQKPGKPLYFGKKGTKYIFGLPGNPASVLTCYYEYVRPAIKLFKNHQYSFPVALQLPLNTAISKKPGLTHFLKAYTDFKTVTPLPDQESYKMNSFMKANCFIIVDEISEQKNEGDLVEVHLF